MIDTSVRLQTGMEVVDRNGEVLGCISVIWPHEPVTREGKPLEPGDPPHKATDTGYIQVDRGGVLGLGAAHWYVPCREIAEIVPGERVVLARDAAECEERYRERPWFADIDIA